MIAINLEAHLRRDILEHWRPSIPQASHLYFLVPFMRQGLPQLEQLPARHSLLILGFRVLTPKTVQKTKRMSELPVLLPPVRRGQTCQHAK